MLLTEAVHFCSILFVGSSCCCYFVCLCIDHFVFVVWIQLNACIVLVPTYFSSGFIVVVIIYSPF